MWSNLFYAFNRIYIFCLNRTFGSRYLKFRLAYSNFTSTNWFWIFWWKLMALACGCVLRMMRLIVVEFSHCTHTNDNLLHTQRALITGRGTKKLPLHNSLKNETFAGDSTIRRLIRHVDKIILYQWWGGGVR